MREQRPLDEFLNPLKEWLQSKSDPRLIMHGNWAEITDVARAAGDFCSAMAKGEGLQMPPEAEKRLMEAAQDFHAAMAKRLEREAKNNRK